MSTDAGTPSTVLDRDGASTLFGRTMGLVGVTAVVFSVGAYFAKDLGQGWGWAFLIAAFLCLLALNVITHRAPDAAVPVLFAFGFLLGAALAPTLGAYAGSDPQVLVESAAATGLFVVGFGAAGYTTRRDLAGWSRGLLLALVALILLGIVQLFVQLPGGTRTYAVAGLAVFAALVAFDFQRLRRDSDLRSAPLLAASIFLDGLNVLHFFMLLLRNGSR